MHCLSCDCLLTDTEAKRKYKLIPEFIDLCNECYFLAFPNVQEGDSNKEVENNENW